MAQPEISLVMMARDEAQWLPRALASAAPWVDEIVLVDTGSADDTVAIAQAHGARVYHHRWAGDFSLHRNQAKGYATGRWCLQLDADEEVAEGSGPLLRGLAAGPAEVMAWNVQIVNIFRGGGRTSFFWPRLFRNVAQVRYERPVHNKLIVPGRIEPCDVVLLHHGYDADEATQLKRARRRQAMMRQWALDAPDDWEAHYYLAQTLVAAPETAAEAADEARLALRLAQASGAATADQSLIHLPLSQALEGLGRHAEAVAQAQAWAELAPRHPDPWLFRARAHYHQGQWAEARQAAKRWLELHQRARADRKALAGFNINTAGQAHSALAVWAVAAAALGDEADARQAAAAAARHPQAGQLARLIVDEAQAKGLPQAQAMLQALLEEPARDGAPAETQADAQALAQEGFAHAQAGRLERARAAYTAALAALPAGDQGEAGILFNLAVVEVGLGQAEAARARLRRCLELAPALPPARELLAKLGESAG